jgi:hypothetical protein
MLANLKIICQFHAHSVHQNSVEIFWAEIYRGRPFFRTVIYRGQLLTLITGSSSRLLRIRFSADLTRYWFQVCHFRCMKFKPLVIWIWNQNIAISTIVGTSSHIRNIVITRYRYTPMVSCSSRPILTLIMPKA